MSRVIYSICCSTQRLLIDMPNNCVGTIDGKTLVAVKKQKNYGTQGRLKGVVQVEELLEED
jgi:hypothetical protein